MRLGSWACRFRGGRRASGRVAVDGAVALDAALGAEEEVVVAFAGGERLDGVGDHAVEPADAVVAGDAEPAGVGRAGRCRRR